MITLDIRHSVHPDHAAELDTDGLRQHFLIENVFPQGGMSATYLHDDRMIVLGAAPGAEWMTFDDSLLDVVKSSFLLERRELGVFNLGGDGEVSVDGQIFTLGRLDGLYVGRGKREILFRSRDAARPARFYMNSAPAHAAHPVRFLPASEQTGDRLGAEATANDRVLTRVIHPAAMPSCQLVMGYTRLAEGNVWNTMPPHTHDRRMEVYLYFDLADDAAVFHFMGRPDETRHLVIRNEQAVVSPPWSIHSGVGTRNYGFVWSMAGENQEFTDMDAAPVPTLR